MPMFEFHCAACGCEFEELVRGAVEHSVPCPQCGGVDTRRLLSSPCLHASAQEKAMRGAALGVRPPRVPPRGGCGSGGFS